MIKRSSSAVRGCAERTSWMGVVGEEGRLVAFVPFAPSPPQKLPITSGTEKEAASPVREAASFVVTITLRNLTDAALFLRSVEVRAKIDTKIDTSAAECRCTTSFLTS